MSHRKLDIDALHLDDDDFEETTIDIDLPSIQLAAQSRVTDVTSLLARGDIINGLHRALDGVQPYSPTTHSAVIPFKVFPLSFFYTLDMCTKVVVDVLTTARTNDIPNLLEQLSPLELDLLFKYIYRAMSFPNLYNCATLLAWHEKLTEVTGVGGIVRVLADRRVI